MKRLIIILTLVVALPLYAQLRMDNVLRAKYMHNELSIVTGGWIGVTQAGGWTFTSDPYIYTTSANVGIGTDSPDSNLTINTGAHIGRDLLVDGQVTIGGGTLSGHKEYDDIQVVFESPSSTSADTLWFWENAKGTTVTIDSILGYSQDVADQDATIVSRIRTGGAPSTVDALTISTVGTDVYYTKETTISDPSIASHEELGLVVPTGAAVLLRLVIYYNYVDQR